MLSCLHFNFMQSTSIKDYIIILIDSTFISVCITSFQIEGVSYRGRVMVEVDMTLGDLPTDKHEEIKVADQKKIMPFLRRRKYKLYAAAFSSSMIHPIDASVEFEVSIGNYGNKLDENTPAQSSTTPPTNPVYDGNAYYFLPWMEQKPCVVVDSQWEDVSYRIESMNILLFTADSLVSARPTGH